MKLTTYKPRLGHDIGGVRIVMIPDESGEWVSRHEAERVAEQLEKAQRDALTTDAYLNYARAEGVEILADRMQQVIDSAKLNSDEIGALAGAIFTGAAIAAQLRAGKDGE